jgi:hypothetical protein
MKREVRECESFTYSSGRTTDPACVGSMPSASGTQGLIETLLLLAGALTSVQMGLTSLLRSRNIVARNPRASLFKLRVLGWFCLVFGLFVLFGMIYEFVSRLGAGR